MFHRILKSWQPILIIVIFLMNCYILTNRQEVVQKNTSVYTQGQTGLSAYEIWLSAGNQGTVSNFLESLKGQNGINVSTIAYAIPAQNGANGSNGQSGKDASPCHVSQDNVGNTTIGCPDGSTATIVKPQDGLNAPDRGTIQIQSNAKTCSLQYKYTADRLFTNIPIPGCVPNV